MRIEKLDPQVIHQIAAGEVIERPASILKELTENCLDAGAKNIEAFLEDGGLKKISLRDDGCGIEESEILLCAERHTTSKLRAFSDLEKMATYGFRGEALSSICAIAEVTITSRPEKNKTANQAKWLHGEVQLPLEKVAAPKGTTITAENIFDRLPARQKYLKTGSTEFSHSARIFRELALANPEVRFSLSHQNKLVANYVAGDRGQRYLEIYRPDWKPVHYKEETADWAFEAWLSPPETYQDRMDVLLILNRRPIKSKAILSCIRSVYMDLFGPHHEPQGVVYLDIRRDWIDPNAHPQKLEVRLLKTEAIFSWLRAFLTKRLTQSQSVVSISIPTEESEPTRYFQAPTKLYVQEKPVASIYQPPLLNPVVPHIEPSRRKYLGQIGAIYLVVEDPEQGLLLIDQHALHEKKRYEELLKQTKLSVQNLLIPAVISLKAEHLNLLEENKSLLQNLGFECEVFGQEELILRSVPEFIQESQAKEIFLELIEHLQVNPENASLEEVRKPLLALMACHSVVRAGKKLETQEALNLIGMIDELQTGWTCPHGRPVALKLSWQEMDKYFQRCG